MSLIIEYKCDLCDDKKEIEAMIAVVFSQVAPPFKLLVFGDSGFRDHRGKHLCKSCVKAIISTNYNQPNSNSQ